MYNNEIIRFQVFFEDPFWVGIIESLDNEGLSVAKKVFYSEPKSYDVYNFILNDYKGMEFSSKVKHEKSFNRKKVNPKRLQRDIKKQLGKMEIGTKSQVAIKKSYEKSKEIRKKNVKENKNQKKELKFQKRIEKKKRKKKGH